MTTDARDRLAGLTRPPDREDLLQGARERTRRALEAAARSGPTPTRPVARWRIRPAVALAAGGLLLLLAGVVAWRSWPAEPAVLVTLPADATPTSGTTGEVVVDVVGEVRAPGVVHLPAGSRVVDALDAAGGPTADAQVAAVNLARVLDDGEQVVVPGPGTATAQQPGLDLNSADAADLEALPGIGPVLARRIVAWRTEHGRFSSVDELAEVTGIGPNLLADLRGQVRV
ncbi:ComEA family DNA-binding protein [Isoptericola sp. b441]|uniref:ComEA family DNA-binding protein n=1 Tax=Actinotalea lenta TaxID=3064654 RepID=A0ABT9DF57_9CELL|nr:MULTISPECIES: ComEA family DNA-binding protein [unclassified Isoptericola]MDO8108132.1 ComEA family DNA-binding protein [Isoptericola sp. b441]MDO8120198.1 ComEA family DNA-binding protein [Isoptericola sp. b490]